jgi:amino acid transporter
MTLGPVEALTASSPRLQDHVRAPTGEQMTSLEADSAAQPTALATGEVTLFGDFVAGITNVAPSTSIALSLGAVMAVSGQAAPSVVILVGLSMLCIAVSYHFLNVWKPSAAAQAMWMARTIKPFTGLAIGFAVILMTLTANVGNITLFGPYLLGIIYPSHQNSAVLQWLCTAIATGLVLFIAIEGVRRAIRFQTIVVWIEYAIIVAFVIGLLVAEYTGHAGSTHPHLSWLLPSTSPSFHGLVDGMVIGVFMFGGWEASVYLAEEGTDTKRNPGRAGIISVIFCIVWFCLLTEAIEAIAPAKDLVANAGNIIAYSAGIIWPKPWSSLVSLAVLSSVVAVTQSQLQNFSRMSYGLSREALLPKWLGKLSRHRTPATALILSAVIPVAALIVYLASTSAGKAIGLISGTAGLLYIVIYVAGAISCIWYYRRTLTSSPRQFVVAGLLPFIGAAALVYAAVEAFPTTPDGTLYPFIVMFILIWPAALLVKYLTKAPFFNLPVQAAHHSPEHGGMEDFQPKAGLTPGVVEAPGGDLPDA